MAPTDITHTYWISIGRNTSCRPLTAHDWERFAAHLRNRVLTANGTIIAEVNGASTWEGEPEDTFLILCTIPDRSVGGLRTHLAFLATTYDQAGIGFVGGPGTDTYIGAA